MPADDHEPGRRQHDTSHGLHRGNDPLATVHGLRVGDRPGRVLRPSWRRGSTGSVDRSRRRVHATPSWWGPGSGGSATSISTATTIWRSGRTTPPARGVPVSRAGRPLRGRRRPRDRAAHDLLQSVQGSWEMAPGYRAVAAAADGDHDDAEARLADVRLRYPRTEAAIGRFLDLCDAAIAWMRTGAEGPVDEVLAAGELVRSDDGQWVERPQDVNL